MANSFQIQLDAANQRIFLAQYKDDGTVDDTSGTIAIDLRDVDGKEVKFRLFQFKNADDGCKIYQMYVLCSAPELAPGQ